MASNSQNQLEHLPQTLSKTSMPEATPLPTSLPGQTPLWQIPGGQDLVTSTPGQHIPNQQSQLSAPAQSNTGVPNNNSGAATKPLDDYLTAFFKSPHYQNLNAYDKARAVEYVTSKRVDPYFQQQGLRSPGISYTQNLAAPWTKPDQTQPQPAGVIGQTIRGVAQGFVEGAEGVVKAGLKINKAASDTEKYFFGNDANFHPQFDTQEQLDNLSLLKADTGDYFDKTFGAPQKLSGKIAKGTGELIGQLPYFTKIAGAIKTIPWVGAAAEGQLLTRLRLVQNIGQDASVVSESIAPGLQKAGAAAVEGAGTAYGLGEDNKTAAEWAAIGAAIPVVGSAGSKLWTVLRGTRGTPGAAAVIKKGLELAKTPVAERPAPQSLGDAVATAVAKTVDANGPDTAVSKIKQATSTVDSQAAGELAKTEFEASRQASPIAKQTNDAVSGIAKAAGVKAPTEHAASDATESVIRGEIAKEVKPTSKLATQPVASTVPETTTALNSQLDAVAKGSKAAIAWSPGNGPSGNIPNNLKMVAMKGQVIVFNPKASNLTADKIKAMVLDNRLNEVLGYPVSKQDVAKAVVKGEKPLVVVAKDKVSGSEVQSAVASTSSAPATVAAVKAAHPTAEVTVQPATSAGEITLDRATGQLRQEYSQLISSEGKHEIDKFKGKATGEFDPTAHEKKISDLAKQFITAGGNTDELDKLMAEMETKRGANLDSVKALIEKSKKGGSAGQVSSQPVAIPAEVATQAISKADKLKAEAKLAQEVATGAKAVNSAPDATAEAQKTTDAVAAAEQQVKAGAKKVTAVSTNSADIKAAKQTIRFELNDLGLNGEENVYRQVLAQFGFKKAEEIPLHQLNDVREALRAAKIKISTFDEVEVNGEKLYKLNNEGEGTETLSPTKVFDATNGHDPNFVHEVSISHPELVGGRSLGNVRADDLLVDLQKKIGPEETDKFLQNLGYDAVTMGKPGKAPEDEEPQYFVQLLKGAEPKSIPITKAEQLSEAATNSGLRDAQEGSSAVDVAMRAQKILEGLKDKKKVSKPTAVTSMAEAQKDTDFFKQAKQELGENANISLVAARAQELKTAAKGK